MKILMVCLGNICRSPLAEGIMRKKSEGLTFEVDSAGTAAYHIGEHPDPRSIAVGQKYQVDIKNLRGRQFIQSDFDAFDLIFAMDQSNYNNIISLARDQADEQKVRLILNESHPGMDLEVPDPYYGGDQGFENVYRMLDEACDAIINNHYND